MTEKVAPPPVALGLSGLRSYVSTSCTIAMVALAAQVVIWSLVTFTDMRFKVVEPVAEQAKVVQAAKPAAPARPSHALPQVVSNAIQPGPIKVRNSFDHLFSDVTTMTVAAGSLAMIVLVLLLTMGVNLFTATAMTGVDRAISAMIWAIVIAVITLPTAEWLGMPWKGSALRSYEVMVREIEAAQARGETFHFYASFLFMPILCLAGVAVIECRFRAAVVRNLPDASHPLLDPELEREASSIKSASLHGGARAGSALDRLVAASREKEMAERVSAQASSKPTEQAPGSEDTCRRLI